MNNLKKAVKKALTCSSGCGHKLDPETCFRHQVGRVAKIIVNERRKLLEKFETLISKEWDKRL